MSLLHQHVIAIVIVLFAACGGTQLARGACWTPPAGWAVRVAPPWPLLDAARQSVPSEQLTQAGRTWFDWLSTSPTSAVLSEQCVCMALALRLTIADGIAVPANVTTQWLVNVSRALANPNGSLACTGSMGNVTAAWLAAGPWCPAPESETLSDRVHNAASLVFHAINVAGMEPVFALSIAVVILVWSVLFAVLGRAFCICTVRCCATGCVKLRNRCAPRRDIYLHSIEELEDMRVTLDDEEEDEDSLPTASSSSSRRVGVGIPVLPSVPDGQRRDSDVGGWTPRGTHRITAKA